MQVIQAALAGRPPASAADVKPEDLTPPARKRKTAHPIDPHAEIVSPGAPESSASHPGAAAKAAQAYGVASGAARLRKPLGEVLELLREGKAKIGALNPWGHAGKPRRSRRTHSS